MKLKRIVCTLLLISAVGLSSLCSAALKYGDKGDDVKEIQDYLIAQNLLHAEADGFYGASTVNAIKDFQTALGLTADGVCGKTTYKLLRAAAYDEIDVTTFKLGDYVPEPSNAPSSIVAPILSAVNVVSEVTQQAGIGDIIKLGMKGDGVSYVQTRLSELGYFDGDANGICDESTINALKKFQKSRGITADGICGKRTYRALDEETPPPSDGQYYSANEPSEDEPFTEFPGYGKVIHVEATAYSSQEPGLSSYTATGTICRRGVIAVDPSVIPLGTKVYIPGYGYAVAEDTGGAIVGNKIDVAFDTISECYEFGRQYIKIYIVD